jgi:hypothetical protein
VGCGAGEGVGVGVGVGDGVPGFAVGGLGAGFGELGRLIGIARGDDTAELDARPTPTRTTRVSRTGRCAWRRGSATAISAGTTSCIAASTDGGRTTTSAPPVNARAHRYADTPAPASAAIVVVPRATVRRRSDPLTVVSLVSTPKDGGAQPECTRSLPSALAW